MSKVNQPQNLVRPVNVTEKLRQLRKRAGLSQAQMSRKLGLKGQSSYQRYENATDFQKAYLPGEFVEKLIPILRGLGEPPIALNEILGLAGLSAIEDVAYQKSAIQSIASEKSPRWIPVLKWGQVNMWINGQLKAADVERYTDASHQEPGEFTFVLKVKDNSMEPDGIKHGDQLVCDPSKPYHPGLIVIAVITGLEEPVVGHFQLRKDASGELITEIAPSHVAYLPYVIDRKHPGQIVGRVVELRKTL